MVVLYYCGNFLLLSFLLPWFELCHTLQGTSKKALDVINWLLKAVDADTEEETLSTAPAAIPSWYV